MLIDYRCGLFTSPDVTTTRTMKGLGPPKLHWWHGDTPVRWVNGDKCSTQRSYILINNHWVAETTNQQARPHIYAQKVYIEKVVGTGVYIHYTVAYELYQEIWPSLHFDLFFFIYFLSTFVKRKSLCLVIIQEYPSQCTRLATSSRSTLYKSI